MAREKKGKVITVTSMKGGVGKTTTTLLLASVYKNLDKKVLIIDLDLYAGSIAFLLNIEYKNDIYNICDDMNNNRYKGITGGEYVFHYDENIDVLPAPKDPRKASKIDRKCLEILLESVSNYYDVVLIDTNHILDMHSMMAFDHSNKIVNIFTNDAIDLKGTKSFVSICKNVKVNNLILVLNEAQDDRKKYFSTYDIKGLINNNIDYTIPESLYVRSFDMYVMEASLFKEFVKLKINSKKVYSSVLKLALRLLEDDKEGALNDEEK